MPLKYGALASPGIAAQPTDQQCVPLPPFADRGIYSLDLDSEEQLAKFPFIRGGRILLQWADLEVAKGQYDFSELNLKLEKLHRLGRKATVQINGLRKPRWLYDEVAVLPRKYRQIADPEGVLQYWDPLYVNAYLQFIEAYARHLKQSPFKNAILGIRQNFNAISTELGDLPDDAIDLKNWKPAPNGHMYDQPWSGEILREYRRKVIAKHISAFCPDIFVFIRNNVFMDNILTAEQIAMVEQGRLGLFHTSTEHQPRQGEVKYQAFLEYCRTGKTIAYAEGWTSIEDGATGGRKTQPQPSRISPCQLSYWRNLLDLHCGVSCIAIRGKDLDLGVDEEFARGFEFANRYAGFHASPAMSPGAWVALREGDTLKGDYNFLMSRLEGRSTDAPLYDQGPLDQRFGGWARGIDPGGRIAFALDRRFAATLKKVIVRVVYLDQGIGGFTVSCDVDGVKKQTRVGKENTGRWREKEISFPEARFTAFNGADIELIADGEQAIFHMVEVIRG